MTASAKPEADTRTACAVCQDKIESSQATCTTVCGHTFHTKCFLKVVSSSSVCPICRAELESGDEEAKKEEEEENIPPVFATIHEMSMLFDFDPREELIALCEEGDTEALKRTLQNGDFPAKSIRHDMTSGTLLHSALYSDSDEMIRMLVEEGVNVNERDRLQMTPLHLAIAKSNALMVDYFLSSGAYIDSRDAVGKTPLAYACAHGMPVIVRLLIDKGASTRDQDLYGNTVLHHAVGHGETCFEILKMVLRCKDTDVDVQNSMGDTALHRAVMMGCKNHVKRLIRQGCATKIKNRVGKTPVDYLASHGRNSESIREMFRSIQ
ncbi:FirrV-1-A31 [Feldmannia irregularis virus a]|uniref:FirrV-1-A31 n=1 Tax=Feldmannia irregularis virus a TaxID=231992 RepID=Q6XM56_9PHYC|nr:FirrV-1-A31 [Feldmannia irregularis virus a]AAR26855.1 FirrV-1-A31 [Feldmannia irregularis virus a]